MHHDYKCTFRMQIMKFDSIFLEDMNGTHIYDMLYFKYELRSVIHSDCDE